MTKRAALLLCRLTCSFTCIFTLVPAAALADDAELARRLQDPLANIKALLTQNDVLFDTGNDDTSYSFQLQPVYALPLDDLDSNLVLRAVAPILGIAPEGQLRIIGDQLAPGGSRTWGLGDLTIQTMLSPRSESAWKWGAGPMLSLRTRTDDDLGGPGWGGGPVGVLIGAPSENSSLALLAGHLWGQDDFSTTVIQPMFWYNPPALPGWSLGYTGAISYDWDGGAGSNWTVPLGAEISRVFALESGIGLSLGLGYYYNVVNPNGAADSTLRFSFGLVLP
ncbi:MAG: hypothetical protein QNK05_07305 [Myxococcota bacterium]|nr:hypothetical protein [Myxococcota bacterium]